MKRCFLIGTALLGCLATAALGQDSFDDANKFDDIAIISRAAAATSTSTTVASVTSTIKQLNYSATGQVAGFLTSSSVLLEFGSGVCSGVGALGVVGHSVTYSGTARTSSNGFQYVGVTSFKNNTTGAAYTAPTKTTTFTAYGPTTGTIKQLNYAEDGSIDGFLFTSGASTIFVATGRTNASLSTLLTVGGSLSVTGITQPPMVCPTTGTITTVSASSLTVGGTTVVFRGFATGR